MASTRELWILLRARDEASRVVSSFSKNVRAAALAAQAAQKSAEAAAIRQQAQMLKTNGTTAQQIRAINENVISLEKQARAQTAAAAKAREYRAEQMKGIESQVRSNNVHASTLERQARALTLASNMADEHRQSLIRVTGATNEQVGVIDNQISALRKRAATLNSEAAVARAASASLVAGLQKEQTGLDGSIRSYERRAAVIRAQAAQLRNFAQEQKVNLDNQVRSLTNQAAALDKQANAFRQSANAAREHDNRMRALIGTMGKVSEASTVAAFALGAVGVGGLAGLKQAIDTTVEYERQVRATATQVDNFAGELKTLSDIGKRVANEIAVPFETIQPALFDIFSSMEVGMADAEKLLKAFSKAAVAGQVEIQDVSRATIGLLNAFQRPASDVTKILDMQFQLIQEGIGTYEEWNQRIGLVTPSAVRAGQSIEMMMAALATATRMGMSAARSGTSVARAMDAMSHPAAVKNMEALGIKVRDAHGKFLPMNDVLRDFRTALMKMPEKKRLEAILDVFKGAGGTIEARRFIQNILLGKGNLELFDQVLDETSNSAGSLEKAYKLMADSTSSKSELLRNKWMLLKEAIGESLLPGFNQLLDVMARALDWFNKLPQGTKDTIAQFILWGSIISIVLGAMFAFMGVAAVFIAAIGTIGATAAIALGVLTLLPVAILAIGVAFAAAYKNSETFRNTVNQIGDNFKQVYDIFVSTAQSIKGSIETHILPPLQRLWGVIQQEVVPVVRKFAGMFENEVIPKIREGARIVQDFADGALKRIGDVIDNTVIPAVQKMSEWWQKNQDTLRPLLQILGQVVKWIMILGAIITGVLLVVLLGPLVAAITLVVIAFQLFWMAIVQVINFIKELWANLQQLPAVFAAMGAAIGGFFTGLWASIVTIFGQILTWFQELPGRIMGFIQSIPSMLLTVFTSALNGAAYAVGFGLGLVYRYFTELVPKVIGFIISLPQRISVIFQNALAKAVLLASQIVVQVANWLRQLPFRAAAAVAALWSRLQGHFESAKNGAVNGGKNLINGYINLMRTLPGKALSAIMSLKSKITGYFAGAGSWLISAGEDLIRGVISGIGNAIGGGVSAARNAAKRMAQGFADALEIGSPSKVFAEMGKFSVQGYAQGIVKEAKRAAKAVASTSTEIMTSGIPQTNQLRFSGAAGAGGGLGMADPGRTFIQTINITTNEIDPRRNAAELGYELEGRLR